jgi:preprotein translocase subunit SecF
MINFLRYSYVSIVASVLFIAAGAASLSYYGGFRYSVDFTGGTQVLLKFNKPFGSDQVKNALVKSGWNDSVIREFSKKEIAVRVQEFSNDSQGLSQKIKDGLEKNLPESEVEILEANAVGPGVGNALRWNSIMAVLLGLFLMLLYIAFRFWSFSYGAGAVIAILHDALAILALFAITQREISPNVICAILATLGYSINDTIVIFAKVRENFVKMRGESPEEIVNISLNQTLRRTLLTSLSTGLVVGALFIFGGETLRNLSLALLVGIVVGTYSSVYIASPIMLLLRRRA